MSFEVIQDCVQTTSFGNLASERHSCFSLLTLLRGGNWNLKIWDISAVTCAIEVKCHRSCHYWIEFLQFAFLIWPSGQVHKRSQEKNNLMMQINSPW